MKLGIVIDDPHIIIRAQYMWRQEALDIPEAYLLKNTDPNKIPKTRMIRPVAVIMHHDHMIETIGREFRNNIFD